MCRRGGGLQSYLISVQRGGRAQHGDRIGWVWHVRAASRGGLRLELPTFVPSSEMQIT